MAQFEKDLNLDAERIRTPAEVDEATGKWVIHTRDTGTIYGLSTDNKPTNVAEGTTFFELDGENDLYVFHKGQWRLI